VLAEDREEPSARLVGRAPAARGERGFELVEHARGRVVRLFDEAIAVAEVLAFLVVEPAS
jgi:hypothetical protein